MPSTTLPSSFASAAAGIAADGAPSRTPRGDGAGFGDWVRPRNGATQTFRRSSNAPSAHQRESSAATSSSAAAPQTASVYSSGHPSTMRNGALVDTRYSKEQLLDLYRDQRDAGHFDGNISHLYVGEGDSAYVNGQSQAARWSRREDATVESLPGPDICWDTALVNEPLGLSHMTDEEKEWFTTSVNSPLKAPNANPNPREGTGTRKLSHSHGAQTASTASTSRPSTRRREPSESFITSPKLGRDEAHSPPPSLTRRRTDARDSSGHTLEDYDKADPSLPFGGTKRSNTSALSGLGSNGPASPWATAPQSAGGLASMGSFGSFALGSNPVERARPGPVRSESRFKGLMSRDSADDMHSIGEKGSRSSLARVDEGLYGGGSSVGDRPVGSAALAADSPPQPRSFNDYVSPQRQRHGLEHGFGPDGANHAGLGSYQGGGQQQSNLETSPTFTNPYHSPSQSASRLDDNEGDAPHDPAQYHLPGLGGFGRQDSHAAFHDRMAGGGGGGFDRSQTSSALGSKTFGALPGLGGLGGLGADPTSLRSPSALQSPALAGLGGAPFGAGVPAPAGVGSIGRGNSRLGSFFPSGMQDQMRSARSTDNETEAFVKSDENAPPYAQAFNQAPGRDTASPFRTGRGKFDDFFGAVDKPNEHQGQGQPQSIGNMGQPHVLQRMPSGVASNAEREPPAAQQKTMVMPDRIRWIYRDPQGNTQGPWTGLEMHDWYRAGFFSPELLVKKFEDQDYEPLAQLIRRIGNSREPFLVPQIGIPAPVSSQPGQAPAQSWMAQPSGGPAQSAQAQPPFAGSFPSFGTTLTAEQQNALERRKQEEQYLMARQKEHLAQQQIMVKHMQAHGAAHSQGPQGLQHHSSAQSLQSQPSYGSITSPAAFNAQMMQGLGQPGQPGAGAYDGGYRGIAPIGSGIDALGHIQEEDTSHSMERLQISHENQHQLGASGSIAQALTDRARLQQEQAEDRTHLSDLEQVHGDGDRLGQFQSLAAETRESFDEQEQTTRPELQAESPTRDLTLTEQVQKAASAKQSPAVTTSPWTGDKQQTQQTQQQQQQQIEEPATVAPPQSSSPLPAPAARRNQKHVAEQLTAESISQSASPSIETPSASVAPWAKEAAETQKQPSLKEIQEAEARRAAKQEEANAAARRAALEREMAAVQAASTPMPGLPTTSTWGNTDSPSATAGTPWSNKAPVGKSATPASQTKKTLQQIQKEEEALARKQRAALLATQAGSATSNVQTLSSGKRYADLASKVSSSAAAAPAGSGWSTVGAGGKAKPPTPSATLTRTASGARNVSTPVVAKPAASLRSVTGSGPVNPAAEAMDAFRKWAIAELRPDLIKGMDPTMFVNEILLNLPVDSVAEAVHQSSQTMDSRHFAEEFVRRRTLAEKGKTVPFAGSGSGSTSSAMGHNSAAHAGVHGSSNANSNSHSAAASGWSEVARKGSSTKAGGPGVAVSTGMEDGLFKVVPAKKKGGRR